MTSRSRIIIVAWLVTSLYYFYQYVARSAPAVMMPQLSEAFGLTAAGLAGLLGLFYWAYSPFSLLAGVAMDQLGARLTVPIEGEAAMLSGTVSLNPAVGPKVESSFTDELKKVYDGGFTTAEVDAAKKAYLESRMVGRATDGALLGLMVSHEQLKRPFKWDSDLESRIQALTAEQINAAFRKHIDPNSVSIVKAGDFKTAGAYVTTKSPQ